jgi:hypothetical protein
MKCRSRRRIGGWPFCGGAAFFSAGRPEDSTNDFPAPLKLFSAPTVMPPLPQAQSPVDFFRQLLAMSPQDRENFLTNRPPEVRERILAKVQRISGARPGRTRVAPARDGIALVSDAAAARIGRRTATRNWRRCPKTSATCQKPPHEWDILPPPLQQEFLDNERTLHYFSHVDPTK